MYVKEDSTCIVYLKEAYKMNSRCERGYTIYFVCKRAVQNGLCMWKRIRHVLCIWKNHTRCERGDDTLLHTYYILYSSFKYTIHDVKEETTCLVYLKEPYKMNSRCERGFTMYVKELCRLVCVCKRGYDIIVYLNEPYKMNSRCERGYTIYYVCKRAVQNGLCMWKTRRHVLCIWKNHTRCSMYVKEVTQCNMYVKKIYSGFMWKI